MMDVSSSRPPDPLVSASGQAVRQYGWQITRPCIGILVMALVASACYSGIDAGIVYLIRPLIDEGLVAKNQQFWAYFPWVLPLIFVLRGLMSFVSGYGMQWVASHLVYTIRRDLFAKILHLPASQFDRYPSSEWLSRLLYQAEHIAHVATEVVTDVIREGCLVIGIVGVMFAIHPQLTAIFILVIPPIVYALVWASRRFRKTSHRIQAAMADVTHVAQEAIANYREIRLFMAESFESARFSQALQIQRGHTMKKAWTQEISVPFIQFLCAVGFAVTVYYAMHAMHSTGPMTLSAGDFTALITAVITLFKPVKQLSAINAAYQQGWAAAESIVSVLQIPPEPDTGHVAISRVQGRIAYHQVGFTYPGTETPVLHEIQITAEPGQWIGFVGRSGSGKTTLLNLLPRFYPDYTGRITCDGVELRDWRLADLRRQIACVSQHVFLFSGTLLHNVAYADPQHPDPKRVQAALEAAQLGDWLASLPYGLQTYIGENGYLLSGGQRQRLAIARALYKNAPIVILDEATAALDTESERLIQEAFQTLMAGRTTLIIAHRLSTVAQADCIYVLDGGRIVGAGTHAQLLQTNSWYQQLYQGQKTGHGPLPSEGGRVVIP